MTKQHEEAHIELGHILARLTYPKSRDEVVDEVRTAGSGDAVVHLIESLPPNTYDSDQAVLNALPTH